MRTVRPQSVISAQLINRLKPRSKPYEVRDSRLTGFLVRVQPSGYKSYVVEWGRGKRKSIGKVGVLSPAQARDFAREVLADAVKGKDPRNHSNRTDSFTLHRYLSKRYGPWILTERKSGKATLERIQSCFGDEFGDRQLSDINAWVIEKWRSRRLKNGIQPSTVNRDIGALRAALQKAVEWSILDSNPIAQLKPKRVDKRPAVRFLSEQEERRLRKAIDAREAEMVRRRERNNLRRLSRGDKPLPPVHDNLKPIVLLAMNTGLRRGELFNLRWSDVQLDRSVVTIHGYQAKSDHTRHVPLNAEAKAILESHQVGRTSSPFVFPNRDGKRLENIRRSWRRVIHTSQLLGFRFHDLRHHFASRLVMAGVPLNTVRELLGHSDINMTLRYAHLADDHAAAAVAKLVR